MNITEFREKHPQYKDMSDEQLAAALHKKHYSDMPKEAFDEKFLVKSPELPTEAPTSPVVEPEAKVDSEPLTIPDDLTITATQFLENGQKVKNTKANAKESLKEVNDSIEKTKSILDKLKD